MNFKALPVLNGCVDGDARDSYAGEPIGYRRVTRSWRGDLEFPTIGVGTPLEWASWRSPTHG
jgi:hypothetical protein